MALSKILKRGLTKITQLLRLKTGSISVLFVSDRTMKAWHKRCLGQSSTTDVLTFDLRDNPNHFEADLVICLDQAKRQAALRGHPTEKELLLYAVHGLLHLLGHDDHSEKSATKMHRREDQLLIKAGFGPVYNRPIQ